MGKNHGLRATLRVRSVARESPPDDNDVMLKFLSRAVAFACVGLGLVGAGCAPRRVS